MKQYKQLIEEVLEGYPVSSGRENMPDVRFIHSHSMKFEFADGFPILTGKEMPFYSILGELIGFMKGCTDVRDYDKLGCKVWWDNAYKWNIPIELRDHISREQYINIGRIESDRKLNKIPLSFDLGRIYAAQWRNWISANEGMYSVKHTDQLLNIISNIINNPYSRYHVMTTWNPGEMNSDDISQPNCHVYFQASLTPYTVNEAHIRRYLSNLLSEDTINKLFANGYNPDKLLYTHLTQRSCDVFLGVPFNITSYAILTILLAIFTNSIPFEFAWTGVNTHLYNNHVEQAVEYKNRDIHKLPKLDIDGIFEFNDILKLNTLSDLKDRFKLIGYERESKIKADLSVGL